MLNTIKKFFKSLFKSSNKVSLALKPFTVLNHFHDENQLVKKQPIHKTHLSLGKVANFEHNSAFSFKVRCQTKKAADSVVFAKLNKHASEGYQLSFNNGKICFLLRSRLGVMGCSTKGAYNDDKMHCIVITYNGDSTPLGFKVYVDKQLVETEIFGLARLYATAITADDLHLGSWNGRYIFDGIIEGFAIYNKELELIEIEALD